MSPETFLPSQCGPDKWDSCLLSPLVIPATPWILSATEHLHWCARIFCSSHPCLFRTRPGTDGGCRLCSSSASLAKVSQQQGFTLLVLTTFVSLQHLSQLPNSKTCCGPSAIKHSSSRLPLCPRRHSQSPSFCRISLHSSEVLFTTSHSDRLSRKKCRSATDCSVVIQADQWLSGARAVRCFLSDSATCFADPPETRLCLSTSAARPPAQNSTQFSVSFDHLCEQRCGEAPLATACGDTGPAASLAPVSSTLSLWPAVSPFF